MQGIHDLSRSSRQWAKDEIAIYLSELSIPTGKREDSKGTTVPATVAYSSPDVTTFAFRKSSQPIDMVLIPVPNLPISYLQPWRMQFMR